MSRVPMMFKVAENSVYIIRRLVLSLATTRRESIPRGSESSSMTPTVAANDRTNRLRPVAASCNAGK
jgi:hypothetical protein